MKKLLTLLFVLLFSSHAFSGTATLSVNPATGQLNGPVPVPGNNPGFVVPSGYTIEWLSGSTFKLDAGAIISGLAFGTMASQNANAVAITGGAITGMSTPVNPSDVATKAYADSVATGITLRTGVAVASTANLTLSAEQTIDGVLTSASRILVKNQTAPAENGIYVTAAGAWARAADSDTAAELLAQYVYFVSGGSTQAASSWAIQAPAPVTLGTDAITFAQFTGSTSYTAGTGLLLTGSVFSLRTALSGLTITTSTYNGNTITSGSATLTGAAGKTFAWNNSITVAGTDGTSHTLPSTNSVLARKDAAQTFTGLQTLGNGYTIPQAAGTTGTTNSPTVGQELYFDPFTNGTTTTIPIPSMNDGDFFRLYFQACDGVASTTFTGVSVYPEGNPNVALPSGIYVPGPAGNHSALLRRVHGKVMLSDDAWQGTYATETGTTNAYVVALSPSLASYPTGSPGFTFIASTANTAACTLNINSVAAKTIKKVQGGITTDLVANDIRVGQVVNVVFDGTNWQMTSPPGNISTPGPVTSTNGSTTSVLSASGGTTIIGNTGSGSTQIFVANSANTTFSAINNTMGVPLVVNGGISVDTNAHLRTTKGNFNLNLNVKDYGAVGNGSTDDTTAIQGAIGALPASGGVLYFPAGTYLFNPSTAGLNTLASKTNLTICGDGIGTSTLLPNVAGQTINIASSCNHVNLFGLTVDGGCTARTTGAHCIYSQAAWTNVHDIEIKHSGEFALFMDGVTDLQVGNVSINTCYADGVHLNNCSRGFVNLCNVDGTDDDCYALSLCTDITVMGGYAKARAYGECLSAGSGAGGSGNDYIASYTYNNTTSVAPSSATYRMNSTTPSSVTLIWVHDTDGGGFNMSTVFFGSSNLTTGNILQIAATATRLTNNQQYTVTGAPTHTGSYTIIPVTFLSSAGTIANGTVCNVAPSSTWGRGVYLAGNTDCLINGLAVAGCKQAGVRGEISGSTRNTRVHLKNLKVRNSTNGFGGGHGIWFVNSTDSSLETCSVEDVAAGSLLQIADWQNLTVSGCHLTQTRAQFCRGIDTGTDITSPTAWNGLKIIGNSINLLSASNNESIRLAPASAVTMTNTAIVGNVSSQTSGGNYIFTDYTAAPTKIISNVSQDGNAIANGGHGTAPTATPNY